MVIDISVPVLMDYLQCIAHKYEALGLALALTPGDIDAMETVTNDNQKLRQVLRIWQEKKIRPFNWDILLAILRSPKLQEIGLADVIHR